MDSVELLLHPIRLRIVQAFLGDRTLTTAGLSAELGDVPPGSLYRQVARLVDAGVLEVVDERRVRGTVERTYRLRLAATAITADQLAAMTPEDHRRAFLAYIAGVLVDFDRYLDHGDIDFTRDGVGYHTAGFWLDDTEFAEFVTELGRVIAPRLTNRPAPGRKRHILRTIHLPGEDTTESD
ncbi:helix-turn-helix domain-containing protein [Nocardia terpenica]|uniref:ArsR family transcriptional regulator n=1 Tax=Nocardia terpenica TaxID=455432 RepID=A0A164INK6_9NOCA|nr:helix-turn-helix domain-containing protein [Nocardia terpenica]KZM69603.1 ArsR family transcriptional regulator [Nocardia terpenica]NQE89375.1 helix-turn-helix domain-containing protein [Nocardia terpenica]